MRWTFLLAIAFSLTACLDDANSTNANASADNASPQTIAEQSADTVKTYPKTNVPADELPGIICEQGIFPNGVPISTAGTPYEKACRMQQLTEMHLEGVDGIYLCDSELYNAAFPGQGDSFSASDVKAILGEAAEKSDILTSFGFIGKRFAVLLIKRGDETEIVATKEQLKQLPITLHTAKAALGWAYLNGALGAGIGQGYHAKAMCGATLKETSNGWLLTNADIFINCSPRERHDMTISSAGKIDLLKKTVMKDSPALCVD